MERARGSVGEKTLTSRLTSARFEVRLKRGLPGSCRGLREIFRFSSLIVIRLLLVALITIYSPNLNLHFTLLWFEHNENLTNSTFSRLRYPP